MIKMILIGGLFLAIVSLGQQFLPKDTKNDISKVVKSAAKEVRHHTSNGYKIVRKVVK